MGKAYFKIQVKNDKVDYRIDNMSEMEIANIFVQLMANDTRLVNPMIIASETFRSDFQKQKIKTARVRGKNLLSIFHPKAKKKKAKKVKMYESDWDRIKRHIMSIFK